MNKLETRVAAQNAVNALAKSLAPGIQEAFMPLVGTKIMLANGGTSAKWNKVLAALDLPGRRPSSCGSFRSSCYVSSGHGYSMTANFRVEMTNDSGTTYADATVYLFGLATDGTVQRNVNYGVHAEYLPTDLTAARIEKARQDVKVARAALSNAESGLRGFGEHDN